MRLSDAQGDSVDANSDTGMPTKDSEIIRAALLTTSRACSHSCSHRHYDLENLLEAPPGFEPGMEVLQIPRGCESCCLVLVFGPSSSPVLPRVRALLDYIWTTTFGRPPHRDARLIQVADY